VIFRWVHCGDSQNNKGCGKAFASINPTFMSSNVPTTIAGTFPFVVAKRGPGMHRMMVYAFVELVTSRVQFGTFADVFNSLYRLDYDMSRLSYYSVHKNYRSNLTTVKLDFPTPYGRFETVGEYNGLKLTRQLVKQIVIQFMGLHEPYLQASFQLRYDKGNTADHTHKYAKVIKASGRKGHVFTASYTVASLLGLVNLCRLVFTKTVYELEKIMVGYKKARLNARAPPLCRFESDNLNGDRGLWLRHFKTDLTRNVIEPPLASVMDSSLLAYAEIDEKAYTVITNRAQANIWATQAYTFLDHDTRTTIHVGLDTENNYSFDGSVDASITHVLQVCMPNYHVTVFHLAAIGATTTFTFPERLKELLEHPKLVAVGVQIGGDLARLKRLGVEVKRRIELRQLATRHNSNQKDGTGLAALTRHYLAKNVDKSGQSHMNNYPATPLPSHLARYAALDALLSLLLVEKILPLVCNTVAGQAIVESPESLAAGTCADLHIGGRLVAKVKIQFVGATQGESRMWGKALVGKGKALVAIRKVIAGNAKPPFLFKAGIES
jgi:3'-5' exonuclease